ncbi:MAG: hypothetical protein GY904_02780 [Planctomycetaceae bacterium]|nr:hypothetical protein [Planctomycetaceae bacterium]
MNRYRFLQIPFFLSLVVAASFAAVPRAAAQPPAGGSRPTAARGQASDEAVPGREEPRESTAATPAGENPADVAAASEIKVSVTPTGRQRFVAGLRASLAVNGANRSDEDTEETVIAMLGDETDSQFARKFWIPANATRSGWLMAEVPEDISSESMSIPLRSIHVKQTGRGEEFQNNFLGMPTSVRQLLMSWENMRTGVMLRSNRRGVESEEMVQNLGDFIYSGRDTVAMEEQDLGMAHLDQGLLPTTARPLEPFDQIVIADDSVLSDSVAVDKIRSWLVSGGRIWIMVDRLRPESVRRLMGEAANYTIVDRVELNEFDHLQPAVFAEAEPITEAWSSEYPAELVRVLVDADEVQCEVNGWPTAFWVSVGQGEVLFTTLSPNGWMNGSEPSSTYEQLSSRFFVRRLSEESQAAELTSYLDDQIGYSIPTRRSVASVLGIHMLLMLLLGAVLVKRKSLHYLAVIVPVTALIAAGSLVAMGKRNTDAIPSTIALGQVGRADPNSKAVRIDALASIYSQQTVDLDVRSGHSTVAEFEEDTAGEVRRVMWDDSGQSRWMFVKQPPGVVRHVASQTEYQAVTQWTAQGRFTEQGFEGQLNGLDSSQCEDAVLVSTASPGMAVKIDTATGRIKTSGDDVLSPGQYIDSALMSDVQQDRQALLRNMLGPESTIINGRPSLLVWSDPVDAGMQFNDEFQRRGTLLASIPVTLMRQEAGSRFVVPPGFVTLENARGASGFSSVYNERTGEWMGRDKAAEAVVRCLVPKSLLPCRLEGVRIDLKMNAPLRSVEIKGMRDGEFVKLFSVEGPAGLVNYTITDPEFLKLDSGGGLSLMLSISDTEQERLAASGQLKEGESAISEDQWQIDYVHFSLEGVTQGTADDASQE